MSLNRCEWLNVENPLYVRYHDEEWGVPVHDDLMHFELLILEGAQAGLSWETILKKRGHYREAFDGFDPAVVAQYDESKFEALMGNAGIVRNKLKIRSAIKNAQVFLEIQKEFGSFDAYIWGKIGGEPIVNGFESIKDVPSKTPLSDAISKDLKNRGMKFVGSTIVYAYMQAVGLVNDHTKACYKYLPVKG